MENIKKRLPVIIKIISLCLISFILLILLSFLLGENTPILFTIPPLNIFLHNSISHAVFNLILLSILIIPEINNYNIKSIIIISSVISLLYLPFVFIGFETVIGISGFCFYLLARFLFTREKYKSFFIFLGIFILIQEFLQIKNLDGVSHEVHIIGYILGYLSINKNLIKFLSKEEHNIFLPLS